MEEKIVKIIDMNNIGKNIKKIRIEKPTGYNFESGNYTTLAIFRPGCMKKRKPFSITSAENDAFLEFQIKIYPERNGFTKKLSELKIGDE